MFGSTSQRVFGSQQLQCDLALEDEHLKKSGHLHGECLLGIDRRLRNRFANWGRIANEIFSPLLFCNILWPLVSICQLYGHLFLPDDLTYSLNSDFTIRYNVRFWILASINWPIIMLNIMMRHLNWFRLKRREAEQKSDGCKKHENTFKLTETVRAYDFKIGVPTRSKRSVACVCWWEMWFCQELWSRRLMWRYYYVTLSLKLHMRIQYICDRRPTSVKMTLLLLTSFRYNMIE